MEKQIWLIFPFMLLLTLIVQADAGQWKTYTVADGLVSPDVTTIKQDRLGNLWIGTRTGGVSRFDGKNFRSFTKKNGLPGGAIKQILKDKRGHLWFIITRNPPEEEGLVCRYDGKELQQITERDGLTGGVSDVALKDKSGNLWMANKYGLTKYDGSKFQYFGEEEFRQFISGQSGTDRQIYAIFESRSSDIWLGGGSKIEHRGGPRSRRQRGLPFAIRYDGSKFHYFSLEHISDFPYSTINAIAEDDAGNLCFGGRFVLLKYDGKRFERFDSEKQPTTEEDLTEKVRPSEVLLTWREPLGTTGEPLFTVDTNLPPWLPGSGEDNRATTRSDSPDSKVGSKDYRYQHRIVWISIDSIFKDSHGHLWFNNRGFISHWDGKELRHFVIPENWEEIKEQIRLDKSESPNFYPGHVVLEDVERSLWFKSENGAHRFDSKDFQTFTVDDGLGSDNISVILAAMDGKFWFGHDNGVTLFDPAPPVIQNFTTRGALGSNSVRFIHEDKEGFIWFSVRGGVARYDGEKLQYFSEQQMSNWSERLSDIRFPPEKNLTVNILDGGKGSLWFVGDWTHQIFQYKDGVFQRLSVWSDTVRPISRYERPPIFGLDNRIFTVDLKGNLWFAIGESPIRCNGENFQLLTTDGFQVIEPDSRISIPDGRRAGRRSITDIHVDSQGNIWFATHGEGVKRYDGVNLRTFTTADGLQSNNIRKIFEDKRGNLWFAGEQTLAEYNGELFKSFSVSDVTGFPAIIYQDIDNLISFIYPDIIARYNGEDVELLKLDKALEISLDERTVRASTTDSEGNLWLATSHGVIKYDGNQFTSYTTEGVFYKSLNGFSGQNFYKSLNGLLVNDIRDVLEDSQGNLWCATWGGGVALYNGETFQAITTKHGLIHNNVRSIFEDSRGNMWFATDGGVTKYTLKTDILPRIKLTKFIADAVYTEFDQELQLPPKVRRLVFEYKGVSFQRAKLLYTYKLEGYDTDWSQPTTENQVEYDGLKPGSYTFLVKALREGSLYSNPPAVLQFAIASPLWAQSQFYLPVSIGGVILLAFVFLIVRLILQWRRAAVLRAQLRQKEEAEIQRVKKELNDAQKMQVGLLPQEAPCIDGIELSATSLPAAEVGGDFYDYLTLKNNLVGIALADVAGKGLRAAMNAVMTNGMLHEVVQFEPKASTILSRLNTDLRPRLYGSMFTALNLGILNPQTKQIHYTNAGQPYPIIKRNGEVGELELSGLPLGLIEDVAYDEDIVGLVSGDYLIFYTDGLVEAMNKAEEIYGFDRLKDNIRNATANFSAEGMMQHILRDIHDFVGEAEQYDDMTIVVLRCK